MNWKMNKGPANKVFNCGDQGYFFYTKQKPEKKSVRQRRLFSQTNQSGPQSLVDQKKLRTKSISHSVKQQKSSECELVLAS